MGLGTKAILRLGRALEKSGRGAWCEVPRTSTAIYFFLYGPKAELTAWLMPHCQQLLHLQKGQNPIPRVIICTDQPEVARIGEASGHYCLFTNLAGVKGRTATSHLKNLLRIHFAQFRPLALYFSPQIKARLPRPNSVMRTILEIASKSRPAIFGIIGNELDEHFRDAIKLFHHSQKVDQAVGRKPIPLFYYGDPAYFDLSQILADEVHLEVKPLGWRAEQQLRRTPSRNQFYLWTATPTIARELRLSICNLLSQLPQEEGLPEIYTFREQGMVGAMLDAIVNKPGLVLADASAPLLSLLSLRTPLCLYRYSSMQSQPGLVRYSFFARTGRWPTLTDSKDLRTAIENYRRGEWGQESACKCAIEEELSETAQQTFINQIYMPHITESE